MRSYEIYHEPYWKYNGITGASRQNANKKLETHIGRARNPIAEIAIFYGPSEFLAKVNRDVNTRAGTNLS